MFKFQNIKEMLFYVCDRYYEKVAFVDIEDGKLIKKTYKDLLEDFAALGTGLNKLGYFNDKIAIIGRNRYAWALSFLVSMCGGNITVPLDKELSTLEIKNCLNRVDVKTLIYSDEFKSKIDGIKSEIPVENFISMDDSELSLEKIIEIGKEELKKGNTTFIDSYIDKDKESEFIFTSGTTNKSKIVMLSHYNIMSNVLGAKDFIDVNENDTFLSLLPIHHTFENTCGLMVPLCSGACIAYNDNLKNVLKNFKTLKPTIVLVVPRFMDVFYGNIQKEAKKLNKDKLINSVTKITSNIKGFDSIKRKIFDSVHEAFGGKLKLIVIGGAAANPKISKFMRGLGFTVLQGYGLTECSPLLTVNKKDDLLDDSVGKAITDTTILIDNPDEYGVGEVIVKGPQVMKGYYNDEKANSEVFKDGYFRTGDLGYFNKNKFLKIMGRGKSLILSSNGKNIYPEELEDIINQNDLVKESLVYADEEHENRIIAEILMNDDILKKMLDNPLYKNEIYQTIKKYIDEVNSNLPDYKRINGVKLREKEFVKTTTLKIKRFDKENK